MTDIFSLQTSLIWKECPNLSFSNLFWSQQERTTDQCVILQKSIYIALKDTNPLQGKLAVFSLDPLQQPSCQIIATPSFDFSLVTYRSQIVIVGGRDSQHENKATDKLWTSKDGGKRWECSLPPMPTKRFSTAAMSFEGSPECLIVAGGNRPSLIQVMKEEQWFTLPHGLPQPCLGKNFVLHKGYLYLAGGFHPQQTLCCKVDSLLTRIQEVGKAAPTTEEEAIWWECEIPFKRFRLLSYAGNLLLINFSSRQSTIYGYHPSTQSWLRLQDLPLNFFEPMVTTVLPTGELFVFYNTNLNYTCNPKGFQCSLKGIATAC